MFVHGENNLIKNYFIFNILVGLRNLILKTFKNCGTLFFSKKKYFKNIEDG